MEQTQPQHPSARQVETRAPASAKLESKRVLTRDPCVVVAGAQAAYYIVSGLWPIVSPRSFAAVMGRKPAGWLSKAVGASLVNAGLTLGRAALSEGSGRRAPISREVSGLGVRFALTFATLDFWYAGVRKRMSPVYMINGAAQLALAGAWFTAMGLRRHARALPPRTAAFA